MAWCIFAFTIHSKWIQFKSLKDERVREEEWKRLKWISKGCKNGRIHLKQWKSWHVSWIYILPLCISINLYNGRMSEQHSFKAVAKHYIKTATAIYHMSNISHWIFVESQMKYHILDGIQDILFKFKNGLILAPFRCTKCEKGVWFLAWRQTKNEAIM